MRDAMSGCEGYRWVRGRWGEVPANAVAGGEDKGETLYVGRAVHQDNLLPGKVHPSNRRCYVSYRNVEESYGEYEVLVCEGAKLAWQPCLDNAIPATAIPGGKTSYGETLYIGRAFHAGTLTCGKVHPSQKCLYIPYRGKEHWYSTYEILICRTDDGCT